MKVNKLFAIVFWLMAIIVTAIGICTLLYALGIARSIVETIGISLEWFWAGIAVTVTTVFCVKKGIELWNT